MLWFPAVCKRFFRRCRRPPFPNEVLVLSAPGFLLSAPRTKAAKRKEETTKARAEFGLQPSSYHDLFDSFRLPLGGLANARQNLRAVLGLCGIVIAP